MGPPEALQRFLMALVPCGVGDGSTPSIGLTPVLADWQAAAREVLPGHPIIDTTFDHAWDADTVY